MHDELYGDTFVDEGDAIEEIYYEGSEGANDWVGGKDDDNEEKEISNVESDILDPFDDDDDSEAVGDSST